MRLITHARETLIRMRPRCLEIAKKVQSEAAEATVTRTHSKINLVSLHETKEDLTILVFFHVYSALLPFPIGCFVCCLQLIIA